MLCFKINIRNNLIAAKECDALIKKEIALEAGNQPESLKFIMESAWPAVKGLESIKLFESLVSSMESEALQWRKWYMDEKAESVELRQWRLSILLLSPCLRVQSPCQPLKWA